MRTMFHAVVAVALLLAACSRTETPELGDPVTIASANASNPTVAIDPRKGDYYVAWVSTANGVSNVLVARSSDGAGFDTPVQANGVPGDAAPHEQAPAQVDVGPDGNVYVIWQKNTSSEGRRYPYSDLRLARSTDGGRTFEPAITVNDDAGGLPSSHTFHDLLVGADGTVVVSWIDGRARSAAEARVAAAPDAHDGHGGHGEDGMPSSEIRVARSTDGGRTFGPSVVVANDVCPCCRTSLAAGPNGELYIGWRTVLANNVRDVVVARSDDGGVSWTTETRVNADDWVFDACPHAGPSIAVDGAGRLHVAWYTGAASAPGIYAAVSTDRGATFGKLTRLLTGEWVPPSQVKLAVGADDRVVIAWDDRRAEAAKLNIAFANAGLTKLLPADASMQGTSPAVAAAAGRFAIAWLDGEAVRVRTSGGRATEVAAR